VSDLRINKLRLQFSDTNSNMQPVDCQPVAWLYETLTISSYFDVSSVCCETFVAAYCWRHNVLF